MNPPYFMRLPIDVIPADTPFGCGTNLPYRVNQSSAWAGRQEALYPLNASGTALRHPVTPGPVPTGSSPERPPTSTYRVQLNAGFTLRTRAPSFHLHDLGVGALYTSPFLCATPGSTHGYDVTDYGHLNPEIGTDEDLQTLTTGLRERGMGVLVDVVPNHMGIAGGANAWWQDVLENGRTSAYADYFDIDWRPLKEELRGKILLPVLGDHYGVVLERGELRLEYADGAFTVHYYETRLPIAPPTYPSSCRSLCRSWSRRCRRTTSHCWSTRASSPPSSGCHPRTSGTPISSRSGGASRSPNVAWPNSSRILRRWPAPSRRPCASSTAIPAIHNRKHGFDALDRLLDAQSYRLSSFRTAGEEINYRRFFAINELAAVRQEIPEVFAAAHALLMRLIRPRRGDRATDRPSGWPMGSRRLLPRSAVRGLDGAEQGEDEGDAGGESAPDDVDWEAIDPALADAWAGQADDGLALAERLPLRGRGEDPGRGRRCRMIGRCTAPSAMSLRASRPVSSSIRRTSVPSTISTPASPGRAGGVFLRRGL